ncbi:hypothetical protein H6P81_000865 [Aristolochia fimbriata]|uniref:Protein kinase domain-containing protein n=1 Tax=Aristolochia fimbriata TaxID=158543 RepID=A0AAV7F8M7_ARIFI|nr:hypothetical protein H6P81_000865 [Aristolochia fimbriata]
MIALPGTWNGRVVASVVGLVVLSLVIIVIVQTTEEESPAPPSHRNRYVTSWVPISDDPDFDEAMKTAFDDRFEATAFSPAPPRKLIIKPRSDTFWPGREDSGMGDAFAEMVRSQSQAYRKAIPLSLGETVIQWALIAAVAIALINCLAKAGNVIETKYRDRNHEYADLATPLTLDVASDRETTVAAPLVSSEIRDFAARKRSMERFFREMAREKPIQFSPEELSVFTHNYATRLGSGAYGEVYKGELPNRVPVAVKVLKGRSSDKRVEEQFMAEVSTIGRTNHINLVKLYGYCFDATVRALVYEYVENGSLDRLLLDKNRALEWRKLQEIAIGTAKGLAYLHEGCQPRIIHYDIKPENVLLDSNLCPKVADFGLAKLCSGDQTHVTMTGFRGTPGYAAPEMWNPFPVTHKCDVYSFGMLLFEIVGRRRNMDESWPESQEWLPRWVWETHEKGELREEITILGIEEEDKEKAERVLKIALWCVQKPPENRPSMSSVVHMLEGGAEVISPPNPFQHLMSHGVDWSASGEVTESTEMTETTEAAGSSGFETARGGTNVDTGSVTVCAFVTETGEGAAESECAIITKTGEGAVESERAIVNRGTTDTSETGEGVTLTQSACATQKGVQSDTETGEIEESHSSISTRVIKNFEIEIEN